MRSYQKMRLGYIYGCLVVGFTCDGGSDPHDYTPKFHLHNLARPFPTVSLAASHAYRLRHVSFTVRYDRHPKVLQEIVDYFSASCPLTKASNRSLDLVLSHHSAHLESLRSTVLYPNILEHEIPVYALAYFGHQDEARKIAERTVQMSANVPDSQVYKFAGGTKSGWLDQLERDFQTIHHAVESNLAELKLVALAHYREE